MGGRKRSSRRGGGGYTKTSKSNSQFISTGSQAQEEEVGIVQASTPQQDQTLDEDVICSIISRLRLREAVRTCVLSRRWRHLWTRLPIFRFNASTIFDSQTLQALYGEQSTLARKDKFQLLAQMTDQFTASVDSVLQQHQGDRVDEFTVEFFLHRIHSHLLDEWVRIAVASKTKKLGLHLRLPFLELFEDELFVNSEIKLYVNSEIKLYDFPAHLLHSSSVKELSLKCCSLKLSDGFNVFNNLRVLELFGVDISENDVNHLLSNCSTLQELSLLHTQQWTAIIIPNHLSQLRSLVVKHCLHLRKIEINAMNLSRILYGGLPTNIIFSRSSRLKHTHIRFVLDSPVQNLDYGFTKLHNNLPNLKFLSFHIVGGSKMLDQRKGLCTFYHLKQLDFLWHANVKMSLFQLGTLLDIAPFLEELNLEFHVPRRVLQKPPQSLTKLRKMLSKRPHTYLKTVEIAGFLCDKWQVEIALYLLTNAVGLKSMTIVKDCNFSVEIHEADVRNLSREVPTDVKFQIV